MSRPKSTPVAAGDATRQCFTKTPFASRKEARDALPAIRRWPGMRNSQGLEVYACPHCSRYHVGHPPKRQRKAE